MKHFLSTLFVFLLISFLFIACGNENQGDIPALNAALKNADIVLSEGESFDNLTQKITCIIPSDIGLSNGNIGHFQFDDDSHSKLFSPETDENGNISEDEFYPICTLKDETFNIYIKSTSTINGVNPKKTWEVTLPRVSSLGEIAQSKYYWDFDWDNNKLTLSYGDTADENAIIGNIEVFSDFYEYQAADLYFSFEMETIIRNGVSSPVVGNPKFTFDYTLNFDVNRNFSFLETTARYDTEKKWNEQFGIYSGTFNQNALWSGENLVIRGNTVLIGSGGAEFGIKGSLNEDATRFIEATDSDFKNGVDGKTWKIEYNYYEEYFQHGVVFTNEADSTQTMEFIFKGSDLASILIP